MTPRNKIVSADEAIAIIRDGDTVCVSGFVGIGTPDELILALERRFLRERHPSALTLVFAAAPGDGKERGLNRLAHAGLLKRVVGGHWGLVPKLQALAVQGEIEPTICRSDASRISIARSRHGGPGRSRRSDCAPSSIRASKAGSSTASRPRIWSSWS